MVVTRKKPSAPAPPTSRTNSTQALSRTVNTKTSHSNLTATSITRSESPSKDTPNGTQTMLKAKPQKSKHKTPLTRQEKRSLLDRLFFLLLATFSIYALYTCPSDFKDNPVCRSLKTYHTHVLEPYIIPPIRAAVSHPTIVQPYEKYAKPVYQSYIEPMTPHVAAAHSRTAPYVKSAIRFSQGALWRFWNNVITPYWSRAVVPRYTLYLRPYANKYVKPLIRRAGYYNDLAEPYVRSFARHTSVYAHRVYKYALVAYERSQPYVSRAHSALKPYVLRGYAQIKPLVCQTARIAQSKGKYVASKAVILFQVALGRIGDLRREFVDPHILRIWEKAIEKSDSSSITKASSTTATITTPVPMHSEITVSMNDIPLTDADVTVSTIEAPQFTAVTTSSNIEFVPLSSTIADDPTSTREPEVPSPSILDTSSEDTLEKAESVAEASAAHASSVIAEMEKEIKEAEAARAVITPSPDHAQPSMPDLSETPSTQLGVSQATAASVSEEEDLDDFLREIGLDEEEKQEPEPIDIPLQEEEDKEARKAATAAKRADIISRHVRWQSELDSLVKDLTVRVKQEIEAIRTEAVAHIGKLPSDKITTAVDGKGKEVLERLQNDGEKLLRGLEVYVGKARSQVVERDELEKEKEKWDKVVDKVDAKFQDVVRTIQEEVHDWYIQSREKEISTVLATAREVKYLADNAQSDIGFDYAWLDDVTYEDWQKYHDLMRTYDRFDQTVRSLQNGTHPDAPTDNLIPILDNLDHEVQNMILGFTVKMDFIIREGDRLFNNDAELMPEQEIEPEDGEHDEECEEEEPQVSVLPISPEPSLEKVDPANVVIGKSAEQIEKMAHQAVADQRIEL